MCELELAHCLSAQVGKVPLVTRDLDAAPDRARVKSKS
jgi:hypothetical protein